MKERKLNQLGKLLKTLRIKYDIYINDMAFTIGIDKSYMSYIENGFRFPPIFFFKKLKENYEFTPEEFEQLRTLIILERNRTKIRLNDFSENDKNLLLMVAQYVEVLDDNQKIEIEKILKGGKDE